ncbi:MAG: hypothetical protein IJQ89_06730 [Bacteroidales bacterium]|nr:hypothetical protein [Bacteroidales bacterium]
MKKIAAFLIIAFATINVWAQSPQGFSYQAVLRNTDGTFVSSRQISVRVGIRHGNAPATRLTPKPTAPRQPPKVCSALW